MGRNKKGFNHKARSVVKTEILQTDEVVIEVDPDKQTKYDESNPYVLPSAKRKTKVIKEKERCTKILSKQQRKKLEKIIEVKKKKANRAELLEALDQVQVSSTQLGLMTSLTSVQTKGIKRCLMEPEKDMKSKHESIESLPDVGDAKKWCQHQKTEEVVGNPSNDCNIIGLQVDDESASESEEDCKEYAMSEERENRGVEIMEEQNALSEVVTERKEAQLSVPVSSTPKSETEPIEVLKEQLASESASKICKPVYVPVYRSAEVQAARLKLPILAEEQTIVEAIKENDVVILAGETGSGKTTQVPQFLYEAGFATGDQIIGVTEPRRVAATSMASRVAHEMNLHDREVGYQIRFEGNANEKTQIKFMTDGVLLKEVQKDFQLSKYSAIIIDEAHERSVYSDILLGLLSRIVRYRKKKGHCLKLIIMSATLRVEDFTENQRLFKIRPPLVQVETRQFPVSIHFSKRTVFDDFVSEAFRKVCKIHRQLPDGGILVFLTGQQEVNTLCRKLRSFFPATRSQLAEKVDSNELLNPSITPTKHSTSKDKVEVIVGCDQEMDEVMERIKKKQQDIKKHKKTVISRPLVNLDHYSALPLADEEKDNDADLVNIHSDDGSDSGDDDDKGNQASALSQPAPSLWVLPLYSLLPTHRQQKVFQSPPEGSRLCVVATNVAETSLTIPGIRYVVDAGRVKTKFYNKVTGVSTFNVTWTSKAAANQRAGRAGRTGPGHCYRLYSSAVFNDEFENFTLPDIMRRPIDDLVLQMKAMDIEKVVHFPFPTPPDAQQLNAAEQRLLLLGALEPPPRNLFMQKSLNLPCASKITPLGRAMATYPVAPRYAKMLLLSQQHDLLPLTITLVATLSVQELLLEQPIDNQSNSGETLQDWTRQRRSWAGVNHSLLLGDPMVLLRAVGAAEYAGASDEFCNQHGIRCKALREVRKLRVQLTNETNLILPVNDSVVVDPHMSPPTDAQAKLLRQILLTGSPDHVARRVNEDEIKESGDKRKFKHAYRCPEIEDVVFLTASCILRHSRPEWIVYQDIYENQGKIFLRGITAIEPEWLPIFCPSQCTFSTPLETPEPRYDTTRGLVLCHMNITFGRSGWLLPVMELEFPSGIDKFKHFAQFILNGSVCPALAKFVNVLLSLPSTMIKTWARLQPRTQLLLQELMRRNVDSYEALLSAWRSEPTYLLAAYQSWLPVALHQQVAAQWPPL